jgi:hypothetical protein
METYSRKELIDLVHPDPSWMNFDVEVIYNKKVISLNDALYTLYTVWDDVEDFERISFIEYAKVLKNNQLDDITVEKRKKIEELYKSKFIDAEIMVPCFLCKDLKTLLPEEYPSAIKTPPEVYIVEDRNHRLTALALRILDGEEIGKIPVTIFYGQIA